MLRPACPARLLASSPEIDIKVYSLRYGVYWHDVLLNPIANPLLTKRAFNISIFRGAMKLPVTIISAIKYERYRAL